MFGSNGTVDYRRSRLLLYVATLRSKCSTVPSLFNGLGIVMSVTIHDEAVVCKGAVLKGTVAIGAGITAVTSRGVLFLVRRKHRIAICTSICL